MSLNRAALAIAMLLGRAAFATPTKGECVNADTAGQDHRRDGHLVKARDELTTCADVVCPEIVRVDCRERLAALKRALPSIVVAANVTGSAFLTLDGASIGTDGAPVDVDPGAHELTLTVPGHTPVTRNIVVKEGEKLHAVSFPAMVAVTPVDVGAPHASSSISTVRIAGIATGVAGLVALGFGIGFGVASFGAWGTAKSECADQSTCNLSSAIADRSRAYDLATGSDVAFVVAGVLVATGVTLFVLGGHATVTASPDRVAFTVGGTF
ncbi:MAG TPA: PEGA domain-containing protein [Polyangiaceae bacterium]|nr:PEGA domain-containing protein [Polyangiaceae bacterium]